MPVKGRQEGGGVRCFVFLPRGSRDTTSLSTDAGPATVQYLGMPRQGEGEYSGLAHVAPNLGERGNASSKDRRTPSASVY
ncbi:hypothetical protein TNCT_410601 [Trichonephila clavata]|uniref:Uncharacterized protein n=1 Tax=Trichonephila clavata TaxID=2740835 RepID=A0A8X6LTS2_TRICU|nr:hypothetical protein TNCT_410601 [Trichonephila clavata]